ncbi:MAG: dipeptide epimerase, partial [Alphaproteobacteria bacterium]|nr:dipeptide epimerase [Alphaproteobacteria bacterium]
MRLSVRKEIWPLKDAFTISRGSRTQTEIVVAELSDGAVRGHGECMANPRYDETQDGVVAALEGLAADIESGALDRAGLQKALPAGAARNALDCAFWDIEAKQANARAWDLAGLAAPQPIDTAYTISLDTPDAMGAKAKANAYRHLLKLKLTGDGDLERVAAVRENAPESRLIVDANEGWTADLVAPFSEQLEKLQVQMIEQPLPEGS